MQDRILDVEHSIQTKAAQGRENINRAMVYALHEKIKACINYESLDECHKVLEIMLAFTGTNVHYYNPNAARVSASNISTLTSPYPSSSPSYTGKGILWRQVAE